MRRIRARKCHAGAGRGDRGDTGALRASGLRRAESDAPDRVVVTTAARDQPRRTLQRRQVRPSSSADRCTPRVANDSCADRPRRSAVPVDAPTRPAPGPRCGAARRGRPNRSRGAPREPRRRLRRHAQTNPRQGQPQRSGSGDSRALGLLGSAAHSPALPAPRPSPPRTATELRHAAIDLSGRRANQTARRSGSAPPRLAAQRASERTPEDAPWETRAPELISRADSPRSASRSGVTTAEPPERLVARPKSDPALDPYPVRRSNSARL